MTLPSETDIPKLKVPKKIVVKLRFANVTK